MENAVDVWREFFNFPIKCFPLFVMPKSIQTTLNTYANQLYEMSQKETKKSTSQKDYGAESQAYFKEHHKPGGATPRIVYFKFKINDISNIDVVNSTVRLDFNMYLRWVDPALIGAEPPHFNRTVAEYETIWNPRIEINNAIETETKWDGDTSWNLKDTTTGLVKYSQRYVTTIHCQMRVHDFPFDGHDITINIGPAFADHTRILLQVDPEGGDEIAVKHNLSEWFLQPLATKTKGMQQLAVAREAMGTVSMSTGRHLSNMNLVFRVQRASEYYVWKILIVQLLIVVWSWVALFMDISDLNSRTSNTLTLFLASVAFLFVISEKVPKVPYLTKMVKFTFGAFFCLFLVGLESFAVYIMAKSNREDIASLAPFVNYYSQIGIPGSVVVVIIGICTGEKMKKLRNGFKARRVGYNSVGSSKVNNDTV